MTQEDIIRMAREAGFSTHHEMIWIDTWEIGPCMQRFAELVRADEREACAKLADLAEPYQAADLIRKRGQA
jgi:hypothetical protein